MLVYFYTEMLHTFIKRDHRTLSIFNNFFTYQLSQLLRYNLLDKFAFLIIG